MIIIKEVKGKRMLKKFIDFPLSLYKNCPYFTPYLFEDELANLTPGKNPASRYCDFKLFLAYKDNKIVGRICAIINRFANEKYHQKRIRFNRIDMIDDIEVTKALTNAVEQYGKENGLEEINGPLGYSDQDKEGLLTYGFDKHNMFATFYTYEYYVQHLKQLGFVQDAKWNEYRIYIPEKVDPLISKIAQRALKNNNLHLFKAKRKKDIYPYVKKALYLVNECYKDLYGFVPIDDDQIDHLAKQYLPLINLDYIQLVLTEDDQLIGLGLMIPTPVFALKKINGHLFPFGFIKFLKALKNEKILDMLLVAVRDDYKNKGINAIIFEDAINNAIKNGVKYAETGPELEVNTAVQSMWKTFKTEKHKERCCFLKKID